MKTRALQICVLISIALSISVGIPDHSFAQGWYDISWKYRKTITIDHTKVPSSDQSNFPMLVSLTTDDDLKAHARSDGFDILFTSSDALTKIPYQREQFTHSNGALLAWVQVPTVSHTTTNTIIYMYYGNASASDQQQATSVWDANYKAVYHLNENTAGTGDYKDATTTGDNGTVKEQVIQAVYNMTVNGGNNFCYQYMNSNVNYAIVNGDYLEYDVYWTSSLDQIAIDFQTVQGNALRGYAVTDQNGISPHPGSDLSTYANNKWYHRKIPISALVGQTINYCDIACEYDLIAAKTAYIANIFITNSGAIQRTIYSQGSAFTPGLHFATAGASCTSMTTVTDLTNRSVGGSMFNSFNADGERYLNMTSSPSNAQNNWTLEGWINPTVLSQSGFFFYNGNDAGGYGLGIGDGTSGLGSKLTGLCGPGAWVPSNFTFTSPYLNTWMHVVMEKASGTGGTISFYVNGTAYSASAGGTSNPNAPNNSFTIGNELNSSSVPYRYFQGLVVEVRISNTARSADWIATEYNNQSSPSTFYTVETEICHVTATVTAFQNVSCNGGHDGAITISASGGTSPYYFSTDNGTTWFPSTGSGTTSPHEFTGLGATNGTTIYRARVRDSDGCLSPSIP